MGQDFFSNFYLKLLREKKRNEYRLRHYQQFLADNFINNIIYKLQNVVFHAYAMVDFSCDSSARADDSHEIASLVFLKTNILLK